ncbi:trypsin-like peptidase domain-containing protein [Deefgea piscis]|uniref:trypsin-like peptidase domain-containing protein n=1 Tax=Deefgea piscis TaxID=2739061 RepID=UPI001C80D965|nr:trypsin-like peptidase domain-containing protein [Deefgea piscis]QZA80525.1 trypsin-like peptidase domain-containing protein [Deefgea piscis]
MKKLWLIFAQTTTIGLAIWFLFSVLSPPPPPPAVVTVKEVPTQTPVSSELSYRGAAKRAKAAVVNIYTSKEVKSGRRALFNDPVLKRFFGERDGEDGSKASSLGSGVLVSPQGYIVTNNHVVESAAEIEVALADGRTASAKLIGSDPETDLAVIKIDLDQLSAIDFANVDQAEIGDVVLAIGNPFGVGQTVTMGIISALGRSELGINTFENFIQTDAAINPGNSGGALVDVHGNLLGINTAIFSKTGGSLGIGFAIPANIVKQVMDAIIKDGSVTRGWLGIEVQDVTPDLAASLKLDSSKGALIAGVVRNGPAAVAGIRPGDVLLNIDGKEVTNSAQMLNLIAALPPEQATPITVIRQGEPLTLSAEIGMRPKFSRR